MVPLRVLENLEGCYKYKDTLRFGAFCLLVLNLFLFSGLSWGGARTGLAGMRCMLSSYNHVQSEQLTLISNKESTTVERCTLTVQKGKDFVCRGIPKRRGSPYEA